MLAHQSLLLSISSSVLPFYRYPFRLLAWTEWDCESKVPCLERQPRAGTRAAHPKSEEAVWNRNSERIDAYNHKAQPPVNNEADLSGNDLWGNIKEVQNAAIVVHQNKLITPTKVLHA